MVVYQALKRLTGFAQVATVLDDSEYQTLMRERRYDNDEESESDDEAGNAYASRTTLGKFLVATTLWEDCQDESLPDPESFTYYVRRGSDSKRLREQAYSRQKVTWLNYSPNSEAFKELALAFPTVSFVIMNLSRRVRFSINCFPVVRK